MFVDCENAVTNVGKLHVRAIRSLCTLDFIGCLRDFLLLKERVATMKNS